MFKKLFKYIVAIVLAVIVAIGVLLAYKYNYIPHRKFSDADFGITRQVSENDADGDGIEDYEDILKSAREYLATKPKYKSKYYAETGYPNDEYGVCTDVVAFALGGAGYDLMQLVSEDIEANGDDYDIAEPDSAIDFRRVKNLKVYFAHTADRLTTNIRKIDQWQAGDIVIWENHIGLISDNRNSKGIPFVLHNANPIQASYEEDILETWGRIVGHYRIAGKIADAGSGKGIDDQQDEKSDDITGSNTEGQDNASDVATTDRDNSESKATSDRDGSVTTEETESIITSAADLKFHETGSGKYSFTYGGDDYSATYTTDHWTIKDSYKINNEHDMTIICQTLIDEHPVHGADMVSYRTADDMVYEWFQHNLIYEVLPSDSQWISHAKDVDFDPKDQNKTFEEIYKDRTGKELTFDEIFR